jgi:adenosylcobinamide-phosphate synthase
MGLSLNAAIVIGALLMEAGFGYPEALFRRIKHPVVWMGALIDALDRRLNDPSMPEARRRLNGVIALGVVIAGSSVAALWIEGLALSLLPDLLALLVMMFVASTLVAAHSLYQHVTAVADALEAGGIEAGREVVAKIVGRDTANLDEAAIARATIESLAENFSDGVVAPSVWGLLLGLPGMAAYKATNTADSMIGHRTERHADFGWAAAKLDDLLNLPASRLSALFLALAAGVRGDASVRRAFTTIRRDARHHRSPNAGWPEAAMAGALGLKLSGPRVYHGAETDDAWIGDGTSEIGSADIRRALALYTVACVVQVVVLVVFALLIAWL